MQTSEGEHVVRAVLMCAATDIPASQKLCGFMGHSVEKGCSRCLKSFPTSQFGDYSGFNHSAWHKRSIESHRKNGMSWKHAKTGSERKEIERKYGIRFTELLRLPYFDTIHYTIVDPMHNDVTA